MTQRTWILYVGDAVSIAVLTFTGFATHREAELSFLPRMVALYFPLSLAWFLLAPSLGLFTTQKTASLSHLWRPALAMIFSAPLAAVLRGFLLNAPVLPIFAAVLAVTSALGMVIWRALYFAFFAWNRRAS